MACSHYVVDKAYNENTHMLGYTLNNASLSSK